MAAAGPHLHSHLTVTADGGTVLADEVQYSLFAIDTDDVTPY